MSESKQGSFSDFVKGKIAIAAPIVSLATLAEGTRRSLSGHGRFAAIVLFGIGTLVLILYNIWITVNVRRSVLDPSVKLRSVSRRRRLIVHAGSILVIALCWTGFGVTASHEHFGHLLFSLGQYRLAARHLEALPPEKRDWRTNDALARCYDELGDPEKAIAVRRAMVEGNVSPRESEAPAGTGKEFQTYCMLAVDLLGENVQGGADRLEKAKVYAEKARLLNPGHPTVFWVLGYIRAVEQADPDVVAQLFDSSREAIARTQMAEKDYKFYMSQHHYWFGKAASAIQQYDLAKRELQAGLGIVDGDPALRTKYRDWFLFILGKNEWANVSDITEPNLAGAVKYWRDITDKDYLVETLTLLGLTHWADGMKAVFAGDREKARERFGAAEKVLSTARQLGRDTWKLCHTLGMLYFSNEDYSSAAANFERCTQIDATEHLGFYWLGRSRYLQHDLEKARKAMERAVEIKPEEPGTHLWLGRILADGGDLAEAVAQFGKCVDSSDRDTLLTAYAGMIACTFDLSSKKKDHSDEQISMREEALAYAQQAMEKRELSNDPNVVVPIARMRAVLWGALAASYAERGENLTLAEKYIENALGARAGDPQCLSTKAWVLARRAELFEDLTADEKKRNCAEARRILQECRDNMPGQDSRKAEILFRLGYVEKLLGNGGTAGALFLEALQCDPRHERAKQELGKSGPM